MTQTNIIVNLEYCSLNSFKCFAVDLQSGRIGADEVIDDTEGKGAEELEERLKEKEAKTHAILLEMVRQTSALSPVLQTADLSETVLDFSPGG